MPVLLVTRTKRYVVLTRTAKLYSPEQPSLKKWGDMQWSQLRLQLIDHLQYNIWVLVHLLDFVGAFAFAVFGSYKALEKRWNLYGIVACGALTALGGGTIRELILRHLPVYFTNRMYLYITLFGVLFAVALYKHFAKIRQYMLVIDAVGLTAFAYIGADKAAAAGLGLAGMIFFATLTAAGGGIFTDIILGKKPAMFVDELYILPAALCGVLYWLIEVHQPTTVATGIVLAIPFIIRVGWLFQRGELALLYVLRGYFLRGFSKLRTEEE